MDCVKDLPVDVLSKIASYKIVFYKIGDPKYLKIKFCHIEALKRIHLKSRKKIYKIEYCIMREGVPFSLKSIDDIITEEKEELLSLLYEEVEDDLYFRVKLDIEVQLVAKLPEKEYEENELSYREIYL